MPSQLAPSRPVGLTRERILAAAARNREQGALSVGELQDADPATLSEEDREARERLLSTLRTIEKHVAASRDLGRAAQKQAAALRDLERAALVLAQRAAREQARRGPRPVRTPSRPRESRRRPLSASRGNPRRARAPSSDDDGSDPPLQVVPLSRFRRDVRRWQEGAAA
jgi:hypothetical protein